MSASFRRKGFVSMSTCVLGVVRSKEPLASGREGGEEATASVGDEGGVEGPARGFG